MICFPFPFIDSCCLCIELVSVVWNVEVDLDVANEAKAAGFPTTFWVFFLL